jgi:hypothetical protein
MSNTNKSSQAKARQQNLNAPSAPTGAGNTGGSQPPHLAAKLRILQRLALDPKFDDAVALMVAASYAGADGTKVLTLNGDLAISVRLSRITAVAVGFKFEE